MGGGIAGLWALRRLVASGYDAYLLEGEAIGAGQTLGAQGILHGGVKYGLDGTDREIAALLRAQPQRWLECFAGRGEMDLRSVKVNAPHQHLWAADSWLARAGATVAVRAMQGEVRKLETREWPEALRAGGHRGAVYELAETVVDVKSVCAALAKPVRERVLRGRVLGMEVVDGEVRQVQCAEGTISAECFIFTAAVGNELPAELMRKGVPVTQRRPLKMIMARGAALAPLYGHCVTVSPKPVCTVTTHSLDGEPVWYIGGGVAEDAVGMNAEAAIALAQRTMAGVFPQLDWSAVRWAVWDVDRAEPAAQSKLPDGPALVEWGKSALCWPTKLVYGPALADRIEAFVSRYASPRSLAAPPRAWPRAEMGRYPWEEAVWI